MTKNAFVQENLYDTEWMNEEGEMRDRVMNSQELAAGLLFLIKEYYIGSFQINENEVTVAFNNGQRFTIFVKERA